MVRLRRAVAGFAGEVYAKLEYMNPMGSVKDRIARHMVEKALADGRLRAGGTVVEASSGNTAMGLAMMAIEYGLRCVMVVRRQTSPEKIDGLRAMGVELVLVDGDLPPEHPDSYNRMARRLAAEIPGAFFPDQHNDRANNEAHYRTTGPEIWRADGGTDRLVRRRHRHRRHGLRCGALPQGAGPQNPSHGGRHRRFGLHRPLPTRPPRPAESDAGRGPGRRGDHRLPGVGTPRRHAPGDRPRRHPRRARARAHRSDLRRRILRRDPLGRSPAGGAPYSGRRGGCRQAHCHPVSRLRHPLPFHDLQRRLDRPHGFLAASAEGENQAAVSCVSTSEPTDSQR